MRRERRVGLLSLDVLRSGANEQIRRYGELVGVPVETVSAVVDIRPALQRLADCDEILIDTPGVGAREQGRFARLAAMLRAARPDETHLVLPAALTPAAQARIAEAFVPLEVSRVVLTRLDEAIGFGVVLNVMDKLEWALSFFSTGQKIPQDLHEACSRRIAELILPVEGSA
jgi:flagellar biosynthesis protein FlhF